MVQLSVVQLLPALNSGGVERGTLEVARALVQSGHRSIVISAGGQLVSQLIAEGSEHLNWPIGKKSLLTLPWIWSLRRWLKEQRITIIHARSRLPAWIGWLAWRGMEPATRPRFITTVHGLYSVSYYSAIMIRGERVIAVSETVRDYLQHYYPKLPTERICVIPRGVNPAEFPYGYRPSAEWLAEWYQQYPQLRDVPVLTLPGRLSRRKSHEELIAVVAQLRSKGFPVCGLIVGGIAPHHRYYAEQLQKKVKEQHLENAIFFTDHRSDMREIYAVSRMVLSLSTKPESFGRTVLEALSLCIPVIGYDHGGVREILSQMYPIGLVPAGDRETLVERVQNLLANTPTISSKPLFSLQRMLDQTLTLYESLHQKM